SQREGVFHNQVLRRASRSPCPQGGRGRGRVSSNVDLEHPLPIARQNAGPLQSPPVVWEPGLATANRNHERGGFFKGFFNCDQPP
ncbi:hypothetical protein KUCAC02_017342, partial [Chaenocephalus aceratus]